MKTLCMMLLFLLINMGSANAQYWIPFQGYNTQTIQTTHSYHINHVPQPIVVYQWVPVVMQQNTVIDNFCLFRRTQTVVTQPVIQWVYQPFLVYR